MSSARVVRCWVKSPQRAQPLRLVATREHSNRTAVDKTEEGGDDVKSSCPLSSGLHTYYNGVQQRGAKARAGANPKKASQFRLQAATRLHEDGIASNRGSACRGEYVSRALYTPARQTMKVGGTPEVHDPTARRMWPKVGSMIGVKS